MKITRAVVNHSSKMNNSFKSNCFIHPFSDITSNLENIFLNFFVSRNGDFFIFLKSLPEILLSRLATEIWRFFKFSKKAINSLLQKAFMATN